MEGLGINPVQLGAQLINIGILLFVLHRFLYKPLNKMLDTRKSDIEKGLALTDELTKKEQMLTQTIEKELNAAKRKGNEIIKESTREGQSRAEAIIKDAEQKAKEIIKDAKNGIEKEKKAAEDKMKEEITKEATELANKALVELLGKSTKEKITQVQIKRIQNK